MIGAMYRQPNSPVSHWQSPENYLHPIVDLNIPIVLGGNFNVDIKYYCGHLVNLLSRLT